MWIPKAKSNFLCNHHFLFHSTIGWRIHFESHPPSHQLSIYLCRNFASVSHLGSYMWPTLGGAILDLMCKEPGVLVSATQNSFKLLNPHLSHDLGICMPFLTYKLNTICNTPIYHPFSIFHDFDHHVVNSTKNDY